MPLLLICGSAIGTKNFVKPPPHVHLTVMPGAEVWVTTADAPEARPYQQFEPDGTCTSATSIEVALMLEHPLTGVASDTLRGPSHPTPLFSVDHYKAVPYRGKFFRVAKIAIHPGVIKAFSLSVLFRCADGHLHGTISVDPDCEPVVLPADMEADL